MYPYADIGERWFELWFRVLETDGDGDCITTLAVLARENVGILCERERTILSVGISPCGSVSDVGWSVIHVLFERVSDAIWAMINWNLGERCKAGSKEGRKGCWETRGLSVTERTPRM